MRLLVVEDSQHLLRSIATALRQSGHAVDVAADGEEGLWLASSGDYDVIVLDIMLPKLDGLGVLDRLRRAGSHSHVLLLTARDTVPDRVRGLQAGADDYLVKPFALEELLARVEALGRRAFGRKESGITIGDLHIDFASRSVTRAGRPFEFTPREFALLEYLARRRGEVVSRPEIETHIYDTRVDPMSNVVDSAVCTLRRKLGPPSLITTRRGHGYVLETTETNPHP